MWIGLQKADDLQVSSSLVRYKPCHHHHPASPRCGRAATRGAKASVTKEEQRRLEAQRKRARAKRAKAAVIGAAVVILPLLAFLVTTR